MKKTFAYILCASFLFSLNSCFKEDDEIISLESLFETAAQHDLEHITPEAMLDALAHHRPILVVGDGRALRSHGLEVVGGEVAVLQECLDLVQLACLSLALQLHQGQLILEMVEDKDILI